ncbi:hypothetical protein QJQ45_025230 [Haematococcus lacustris]|nr:hypothetical protein QJQ45_025230 [Haematococcus lacustris]
MAASSIGPGAQIDPLTDDNYQFWQIRVRNALIEHNLFQIVDRGITPLPTAPNQGSSQATQDAYAAALTVRDAENTADAKAKAMILRYVSVQHLFAVDSAASAKVAWDNIKAEYTQSSLAHQTQLQQQLSMLRLNPGETISQFFSRLQMLQANLRACNCNPSDTSIVLSVLAAMPDEFRPTVEQLRYDQSSAALALSKVKTVLQYREADLQLDQQKQLDTSSSSSLWASSSSFSPRGAGYSGGSGWRGRGGRVPQPGRSSSAAMQRSSSPAHSDHSTREENPHAHMTCHFCNKEGHIMSECRVFDRNQRERLRSMLLSSPGRADDSPARTSGHSPGRAGSPGKGITYSPAAGKSSLSPNRARLFTSRYGQPVSAQNPRQQLIDGDPHKPYFIDSGASRHICTSVSTLTGFRSYPAPQPVYLAAAGHQLNAVGEGDAWLRTDQGTLCLKNALLVPSASANFVSVAQATAAGYKFLFQMDSCLMEGSYRGHSLCMECQALRRLHRSSSCWTQQAAATAGLQFPPVWHERLGHASVLERMQREHLVSGVDTTASHFRAAGSDPAVCEGCALGKQHRHVHFPLPSPNAPVVTAALELVHMDVCGPFSLAARDGSRYLATFLDDFTKFSVVMPLRSKDQVPDCIITVIQQLETQSGSRCKAIRIDNGSEYVNKKVQAFCSSKGILHQHSAPYSPEQNGAAERLNRTIVEKLRSMLHAAHLPVEFWADSAKAANHVRNVLPVTGQSQTPWQAFFGVKPDVSGLRIFGSKVWVHIPRHQRSKLQPKAAAGVFIGYQPGSKAYKVFLDGREQMSKDVTFDELSPATDDLTKTRTGSQRALPDSMLLRPYPPSPQPDLQPARLPDEGDRRQQQQQQQQQQTDTSDSGSDDSGSPDRTSSSSSSSSNSSSAPGSSAQHPRSRPIDWRVIQDDSDSGQSDGEDSKSQLSLHATSMSTSHDNDSPSVSEALSGPHADMWREAMRSELESLHANQTWCLTERPSGARVLPTKWVLKIKRDAAGDIERFKARLVAKGFLQMSGVDVGDVYAPVSKHTTLRTILAKAAAENMEIHQIDFETAFLNGKLEEHEVIFVQQPEGFEEGSSNTVCRLQKALYGLRQAPRAWHARL